ncbi:hypothetical protein L1049_018620 [Liquidambar formosana]|uniref:RNase H type-1 domain-containing protein n=1 Tax=Liquidambar formosana TaxID=63359 RepID=A0AAP0RAB8_LIQFO
MSTLLHTAVPNPNPGIQNLHTHTDTPTVALSRVKKRQGQGVLIRDSNGNWVTGFACQLRSCNSLAAEIHGGSQGLLMAWHQGLHNIILEVDAQVAVTLLKEDTIVTLIVT